MPWNKCLIWQKFGERLQTEIFPIIMFQTLLTMRCIQASFFGKTDLTLVVRYYYKSVNNYWKRTHVFTYDWKRKKTIDFIIHKYYIICIIKNYKFFYFIFLVFYSYSRRWDYIASVKWILKFYLGKIIKEFMWVGTDVSKIFFSLYTRCPNFDRKLPVNYEYLKSYPAFSKYKITVYCISKQCSSEETKIYL